MNLIIYLSHLSKNPDTDVPKLPLWPMASFVNITSDGFLVLKQGSFQITSNFKCDIIEKNILHYTNILFPPRMNLNKSSLNDTLATELKIQISIPNCPSYPDASMDESCN